MEYQKIKDLLHNTPNQPSKFKTKNWVAINDGSYGAKNTGGQIKFKTSMVKPYLCDYSDANIPLKETIIITGAGTGDDAKLADEK